MKQLVQQEEADKYVLIKHVTVSLCIFCHHPWIQDDVISMDCPHWFVCGEQKVFLFNAEQSRRMKCELNPWEGTLTMESGVIYHKVATSRLW